jgi:hypothetical protein
LARNVLYAAVMSRRLTLLLLLFSSPTQAIEVETEASGSSDFFYARTHADGELFDGHAALGGGLELVSDFHLARVGLEANADAMGEHFTGGLSAGWAPRQADRGWLWLAPHAGARLDRERWSLDGDLSVKLRRADVGLGRAVVPVEQLQLRFEGHATVGRWTLGVRALYSFYDPDLGRLGSAADAGILITMGGRPERWAAALDGGRDLPRGVHLALGLAAIGYAARSTVALSPQLGLKVGPYRGVTVGASFELVFPLDDEPPHPIGGLSLEYAR